MTVYPTLKIDLKRFRVLFGQLKHVRYKLGEKPIVSAAPKYITKSDCSGFLRWIMANSTSPSVILKPGSYHQRKWAEDMGFKHYGRDGYRENCGLHDGRLRLCFIRTEGDKVGHVWATLNGKTYECYGGHGVGSRAWNTPVLLENVDDVFVISNPME